MAPRGLRQDQGVLRASEPEEVAALVAWPVRVMGDAEGRAEEVRIRLRRRRGMLLVVAVKSEEGRRKTLRRGVMVNGIRDCSCCRGRCWGWCRGCARCVVVCLEVIEFVGVAEVVDVEVDMVRVAAGGVALGRVRWSWWSNKPWARTDVRNWTWP